MHVPQPLSAAPCLWALGPRAAEGHCGARGARLHVPGAGPQGQPFTRCHEGRAESPGPVRVPPGVSPWFRPQGLAVGLARTGTFGGCLPFAVSLPCPLVMPLTVPLNTRIRVLVPGQAQLSDRRHGGNAEPIGHRTSP